MIAVSFGASGLDGVGGPLWADEDCAAVAGAECTGIRDRWDAKCEWVEIAASFGASGPDCVGGLLWAEGVRRYAAESDAQSRQRFPFTRFSWPSLSSWGRSLIARRRQGGVGLESLVRQ